MASTDPLLTTLCSVCRTNPPRYKCPRCNLPYCSVPCNRRHRARAGCSGIRDVTTFVPRARLCTAAGIDRDYNFLQGIDVARNSAVKHVVDERRVLRANDVRARVLNEDDPAGDNTTSSKMSHGKKGHQRTHHSGPALVKQWDGEEVVYLPARPRLTGAAAAAAAAAATQHGDSDDDADDDNADGDGSDDDTAAKPNASAAPRIPVYEAATSHRVRSMCRRDGIALLGAPRGFARQRENHTTVATATATSKDGGRVTQVHLHWQVEWLVYTSSEAAPPTRVLRRVLDDLPLYRAYAALQTAERKKQEKLGGGLVSEVGGVGEAEDSGDGDDNDTMDTRGDGEAAGPSLSKKQMKLQKQKQQQQQQQATKTSAPAPTAPFHNSFFYRCDVQSPATASWSTRTLQSGTDTETRDDAAQRAARTRFRYYLLRPRVSGVAHHAQAKELISLDATDTLATALPGRSVLEFPTIYVLPKDGAVLLPPGHVLGSTERRPRAAPSPPPPPHAGRHGKAPNGLFKRRQNGGGPDTPAAKKRKTAEAEGGAGDDTGSAAAAPAAAELESETSSSGSDSSDEAGESAEEAEEAAAGSLPDLLHGLGSAGSLPSDGKPKLVVYDSWSEGSDEE
ncbi:hypothetical protein HMPREF1624_08078 [Sporothrix schenckii ATCC 58251]|uniref:HIT-type domain-containing protein n=1 Tax=Sporothrix schenckii (strain ATCC 58251 / de Perez 2211183) TaxID=1391915 RepID=U7PJ50_SPOS1|nr:hypothetical protein HMPREF1624_08078 [Sporothrix schenckii ATCC 58251]